MSPFQTGLSPSSPFAALGKFSEIGTREGQCSPAPIGSETFNHVASSVVRLGELLIVW